MNLTNIQFHALNVAFAAVVALVLVVPVIAGAQGGAATDLSYVGNLFAQIENIISAVLIPLVLALALLLFIWGVIQYFILGADDEGRRETGRAYMLYAIIGLVAIVAVWGLVNLVLQLLGVGTDTAPPAPTIPS